MAFAPVFGRPFAPTFDRHAVTAAGNGLLTNLIAYWPGNEASGNLLDLHSNALHMTDVNTVTSAAGKVYATARLYTPANGEFHERPGDDALLSTGDVDFTFAAWVYPVGTSGGGVNAILSKNSAVGQREYAFRVTSFSVNPNGTFGAWVTLNNNPVPLNAWTFIVAWHDSTENTINIQNDNGAVATVSHALGVLDGPGKFTIGCDVAFGFLMDGRIGPVAMWKSAAGGGGVLTAAQRTALYNAGAGLVYSAFTA